MVSRGQKIEVPPYFGRFQKLVAYVGFGLFQITLFVMIFLTVYAICTLNFSLIVLMATVSIFQSFATRSQSYIHFVNNIIQPRQYLKQFEVFYEEQIPDETQQSSLFGIHPHGVFSLGLSGNMNFERGPLSRMVGLASRAMLCVPIIGLILRWYGMESVHGENMKKIMKQRKNIGLLPGGFQEATMTTPKQLRVYIRQRKGFIKYAMEHNYTIYPVLILNQHQAFWTFDHLLGFRLWLNKLKLPSVWFFNRKSLLICPFDIRMYTVVGRAIRFRHYEPHEIPTQDQIDEVHGEYISEMQRVYAKYAELNNNVPMVIY